MRGSSSRRRREEHLDPRRRAAFLSSTPQRGLTWSALAAGRVFMRFGISVLSLLLVRCRMSVFGQIGDLDFRDAAILSAAPFQRKDIGLIGRVN